jgi:arylsulfatase A-like enzyme
MVLKRGCARFRGATGYVVALVAALVAPGPAPASTEETAPPRTRVVLITVDTLRLDALLPPDASAPAMPAMAARAENGLQFTRFYSAATVTQPSHATLLTGLHPWRHGVSRNGQVLGAGFETVAETLQSAGYQTAAVVASFPVSSRFGFKQGFERFTEEFQRDFRKRKTWEKEWEIPVGRFFSLADRVTELAIAAIDGADGVRQFFWFHYFDPHMPYGDNQGEGLSRKEIIQQIKSDDAAGVGPVLARARNLYRVDVAFLDAAMERLFKRIDRDRDQFTTHILVVSDHGESLGEDNSVGHGTRLTNAQVRIPAFILSPRVRPGKRGDVAGSIDVPRTLLSLAGVAAPDVMGGRDLLDSDQASAGAFGMRRTFAGAPPGELRLDGKTYALEPYLFYAVDARGQEVRGSGNALQAGSSLRVGGAGSAQLLQLFRSFEAQLGAAGGQAGGSGLDPEVERALEALGYVR